MKTFILILLIVVIIVILYFLLRKKKPITTTTLIPTTTQVPTTQLPTTTNLPTTTQVPTTITSTVNIINASDSLFVDNVTVDGTTVSGLILPYSTGPGQSGVAESVYPFVSVSVSISNLDITGIYSIQVTDGDLVSYCQEVYYNGTFDFNGIVFNGNTINIMITNLACSTI